MERQAQGAIWLNRLGSEYLDNINHSKCFEFEGKIGKKVNKNSISWILFSQKSKFIEILSKNKRNRRFTV